MYLCGFNISEEVLTHSQLIEERINNKSEKTIL